MAEGVPAFGPPLLCTDCGVNTGHIGGIGEYYMVKPGVWAQAMDTDRGFLCIRCLEDRLGRKLTLDDFEDCPLTDQPYPGASPLLLDRLGLA